MCPDNCCKVETGKYGGTAWCDHRCDKCDYLSLFQDELHVLMKCPATWLENLDVVLYCDWDLKRMFAVQNIRRVSDFVSKCMKMADSNR